MLVAICHLGIVLPCLISPNSIHQPMSTLSIVVTHTLIDESPTDNPEEASIVTRGMMRNRAVELAVMNGRSPQDATKADWEDAKRELIGSPKKTSQSAL